MPALHHQSTPQFGTRRRWSGLIAAAAVLLSLATSAAAAEPQSIESFLAQKENWRAYAQAGLTLRLEGRYTGLSRRIIRFENCDLFFEAPSGAELPRLVGSSRTAEVTGHLIQRGGRFVFIVRGLTSRPSDLESLRARRAEIIRRGDAESRYVVGEWAARRADFYEDEELQREADAVNLEGLTIERNALAADDIDGRLALAEKARRLELPDAVRVELLHEAYRIEWDDLRKPEQPNQQGFLEKLARDLPGSTEPLKALAPELEKSYSALPLAAYTRADLSERRTLHRLFYTEVVLAMILRDVQPDGRNGAEIAQRIEERLPERRALAQQHRNAELQWRLTRVASLPRSEMLALAEEFAEGGQPDKAVETKQNWLAARTERLRQDGASGLVVAAEEYVNLLDDRETAIKLLLEAYRLAPESKQVAAALGRHGYVWRLGQWLPAEEAEAIPLSPVQQAIREGRISAGMTAVHVRQALGAPSSITRVATAEQVNEVWTYGEPNSSRLAIHFLRPRQRPPAEARVAGISQIGP